MMLAPESMVSRSLCSAAMLSVLMLSALGCGGTQAGPKLYSVSGKVSFDSVPVENGFITFKDQAGVVRSYGGEVKNGSFSVPIEPGAKTVEITASREVPGKTMPGPSGGEVPAVESYIPPQYNARSQLKVDIEPKNRNDLDFDLTSKK
ncbi:hypothetical protein [Planctomicrobium sp. SH527]|uniref:hypothetical protein n=1 Tax=Planctomicrobium sp. SH527 TaxID=3448123 RepID=UPI003F5B38A6